MINNLPHILLSLDLVSKSKYDDLIKPFVTAEKYLKKEK